jgi:HK97 family phage major capsid protein
MEFSEFTSQVKENNDRLIALMDKQQKEIKNHGQISTTTQAQLQDVKTELTSLNETLTKERERRVELEASMKRIGMAPPERAKSLGEIFTSSPQYKKFAGDPSAQTMDGVTVSNLNGYMKQAEGAGGMEKKDDPITNDPSIFSTTPPYLYTPTFLPTVYGPLPRKISIRELMPNIPTSTGVIEYSQEIIASVSDGTAVTLEGNTANESHMTFLDKIAYCKQIDTFLPITRQALMDIPRLQTYVNYRLMLLLRWKEDYELLYGDGTSDHLSGFSTAGVQTYNWSDGIVDDTMGDAVLRAMTKVSSSNFVSSGIVMHFNDWSKIVTAKASTSGVYMYTGAMATPSVAGVDTLWGLPVAKTVAINEGEFLVGAFDLAAELHDRMQATIRVGEPTDYFLKKKLALLAEERVELIVTRPAAFVWGTFDNTPTS